MFSRISKVVVVAAMAVGLSGAALADTDSSDAKIYSGSFCSDSSTDITKWRGRLFNQGTDAEWVSCPFVRDVVGAGGTVAATVRVVDRHYSADFSCGVWSQNTGSGDGWSGYSVSRSSSGSSEAVQVLAFPSLSHYASSSMLVMECNMPGKYAGNASQIVSYSTIES